MTQSRDQQVSLEDTPFYHCYVRCVRRAYLCGEDHLTGVSYAHRKQWIASRIRFLSYVYAIDVCAYAVMDNHYHIVLHVDKARAESWSKEEVAERWMQLYKGDILVDRWLANPNAMDEVTLAKVYEIIEKWRERLYEMGWFMRGINETVARMANEEENCKGRFWEGRYKSQALLDEKALLSCMAYVDLNPIRAAKTDDTVTSDYTSIQQRLFDFIENKKRKTQAEKHTHTQLKTHVNKQQAIKQQLEKQLNIPAMPQAPMMPFSGSSHTHIDDALPFTLKDYFELVDTTGRVIREDKRGFIKNQTPPILARLGIEDKAWLESVKHFHSRYGRAVGAADRVLEYAKRLKGKGNLGLWCKGVNKLASV